MTTLVIFVDKIEIDDFRARAYAITIVFDGTKRPRFMIGSCLRERNRTTAHHHEVGRSVLRGLPHRHFTNVVVEVRTPVPRPYTRGPRRREIG